MYSSSLYLNSELDGVGGQRFCPAALPPENSPGIHIIIFLCLTTIFRICIIIYLTKTMFLVYIVLQFFFFHILFYTLLRMLHVLRTFTLALSAACLRCTEWLLSVVLDVVLSRYVVQTFSEGFWDDSNCSRFYSYHFWFTHHICCISNVRSSCFQIFSAFLSLSHSCVQKLKHLLTL